MATLRTGPFMVPNFTCSGTPITHLFLNFTNLSRRTLTATVRVDQILYPSTQVHPPAQMTVLLPPTPIRLTPSSGVMLAQQIVPTTTNSTDPQVLVVTVSGDVDLAGDLIEVSVGGGFSSDGGASLDDAEPTMFFRHSDFKVVSGGHHEPYHHHPLSPKHDKSSD